ncbi:hypothetical protein [Brachybacterium paraconglomeratum]|uniref:hypothetical protein n=1 Tax=Brachybacterium paraconglomeratum TaxID=173362 RepID=UPI0035154FEC
MPTRTIAPIVGASEATVRRDIPRASFDAPVTEPRQITGREGKTYSTPPPRGKTPRKFEHLEALRGRAGNGDHHLIRAEYVALVMLSTYAGKDLTSARPGHARLAADLGYAGSNAQCTVRNLLASLLRNGYIVITHKGTNVVGNVATEYRLARPEWKASASPDMLPPSGTERARREGFMSLEVP